MATETRTFVGKSGTHYNDGFAGFRLGQAYQLTFAPDPNNSTQVAIELPHGSPGAGPLVLSAQVFASIFTR